MKLLKFNRRKTLVTSYVFSVGIGSLFLACNLFYQKSVSGILLSSTSLYFFWSTFKSSSLRKKQELPSLNEHRSLNMFEKIGQWITGIISSILLLVLIYAIFYYSFSFIEFGLGFTLFMIFASIIFLMPYSVASLYYVFNIEDFLLSETSENPSKDINEV